MSLKKFRREIGFMVGVAIYLIILIIAGVGLSPDSLLFPGLIMVAAGVIIGLKLLIFKFPQLGFLDPGSNIGSMIRGDTDQASQEQEKTSAPLPLSGPVAFIVWLVTFPLGIYLVGFVVTVGVWLFGFLFVISRLKLLKALIICVCTLAGIYIVFIVALKVHFPPGLLF
jgi:hypothetical protein